MAKLVFEKSVNIRNKKASFEYEFLEKFTAGMVLTGTEIKSIRMAKVQMLDAYCVFTDEELFVIQLHISPYEKGGFYNHSPLRPRKLLLKNKELKKLQSKSEEKGMTIVPVRIFINEKGLAKMEIALARGKKLFDKRNTIKERDNQRELDKGL